MPGRIASTLRILHSGPRFLRDFDMLGLAERYRTVIEARGFPIPDSYPARRPVIRDIGAALAVHPLPSVPCHNDLLADNYIEQADGSAWWTGSTAQRRPRVRLGNTCRELDYDGPGSKSSAGVLATSPLLVARVCLTIV
jgi:hypothetical protein